MEPNAGTNGIVAPTTSGLSYARRRATEVFL